MKKNLEEVMKTYNSSGKEGKDKIYALLGLAGYIYSELGDAVEGSVEDLQDINNLIGAGKEDKVSNWEATYKKAYAQIQKHIGDERFESYVDFFKNLSI